MPRSLNFYYSALERDDAVALLSNGFRLLTGRTRVSETAWGEECQRLLTSLTGSVSAYAFPSARAALLATLRAMQIGQGDEVLVTGFTCVAVPAPILYVGARPVYVDISLATFNMDVRRVADRISPRTKAIIAQHTFGNPVEMDPILEVAGRHRLYVIEDCCLALGSLHRHLPIGRRGDASIMSFELSKTVTAGWGGAVWVNNAGLVRSLGEIHACCGFLPRWEAARLAWQVALSYLIYHPSFYHIGKYLGAVLYRTGIFRVSTRQAEARGQMPPGYLDRLSDGHWQVILDQFRRLDRIAEQSRRVSAVYQDVLARNGHRTFPEVPPERTPVWIRFPFLVANRDGMRRYFGRRGIEVGHWFDSPVSGAADLATFGYTTGECRTAEFVSRHIVNLPVHTRLSPHDVQRIAGALDAYLKRHPENQEFSERASALSYG